MYIAQHHNDWFSLIKISDTLLRLMVLILAFPQGLNVIRRLATILIKIEQIKAVLRQLLNPQKRKFPVVGLFIIPEGLR